MRGLLFILFLGFLLLAWALVQSGLGRDPLVASPFLVRPDSNFEVKTNQPPPPPPDPDANWVDNVSMALSEDELRVEFTRPNLPYNQAGLYDFQVIHADSNFLARFPGGQITMKAVATSPTTALPDPGRYSVSLPGQFFSPDGRALSETAIAEITSKWERTLRYSGLWPRFKFFFETSDLEHFKFLSSAVYDARTHQTLTAGYSSSHSDGHLYVDHEIAGWHSPPVMLLLDMATGSPIETVIPVEPGSSGTAGWATVMVLAIMEGASHSWSSATEQAGDHEKQVLRLGLNPEETPTATVLLSTQPGASSLPITIELLGRNGEPLRATGGGTSDSMVLRSVEGSLEDLESVRLRFYPNIYRLAFHLPNLPGLPANQPTNLFDIHLPLVRVNRPYELRDLIKKTTQLDMNYSRISIQPGAGAFPRYYTNTTPRELLAEYVHLAGLTQPIGVDQQTMRIEAIEPWYIQVKNRFLKFFQ